MVIGEKMISMLDVFLGYNQVLVVDEDHHKISFATLWGIFSY